MSKSLEDLTAEIAYLQQEANAINSKYREVLKKLNQLKEDKLKLEKKSYYVYLVTVDGEVKYIGKGKADRYKHAVSGSSSVPELNRDYFQGKLIEVYIMHDNRNLTEKEAITMEADYIGSHAELIKPRQLYNKSYPKTYNFWDVDLLEWAKLITDNRESRCKIKSMATHQSM